MKTLYSVFLAVAIFTLPMTASALTFKKGQVLGPDGQVYDGASPQIRERLIAEAAEATKEAWANISQEDLAEATAYAAEYAAQEAAKIAAAEDISAQLDALIASGASEAEVDAFIEANPPE